MDSTIPTTIAHGFNHGQLNAINIHQKNLSMSCPEWIQPFQKPLPMVLTMGHGSFIIKPIYFFKPIIFL